MGTKKAVFTTSSKNFRRSTKKLSPAVPKGKINNIFFLNILFEKGSYGHEESSFHNLADSLSAKRQNIQLKVWKKYHIIYFSKKLSFVNLFFWTHWVQLSQCRQKVSNEAAKLTRSISKTAKTSILLTQTKCFSQKLWHRTSKCSLTTPSKVSQQMVKMLLLKVRKK